MSDERLKKIESDIEAIREVLYKNNLMARPKPPAPVYPTAVATDLRISTIHGVKGATLEFRYACSCGEVHERRLMGATVHRGATGKRLLECTNNVITHVSFRFPEDEAKIAVREAMESQF